MTSTPEQCYMYVPLNSEDLSIVSSVINSTYNKQQDWLVLYWKNNILIILSEKLNAIWNLLKWIKVVKIYTTFLLWLDQIAMDIEIRLSFICINLIICRHLIFVTFFQEWDAVIKMAKDQNRAGDHDAIYII